MTGGREEWWLLANVNTFFVSTSSHLYSFILPELTRILYSTVMKETPKSYISVVSNCYTEKNLVD